MKVFTGKVVDGKVELPPGVLEEGVTVAIVAEDDSEPFTLTAEEQAELTESMQSIARGEWVDGDELLAELRTRRKA